MCAQNRHREVAPPGKRWARRGIGCLVVIILIPLIYYGLYFLMRGPLPSNPQQIAHRGGPEYAPENTMAAFRNAVEIGVDWLEMDVRRTEDGVLVVIHDETVNQTTDGDGRVADKTFGYIKTLDAGDGESVPAFDEVIELAREAGVGLLPEIKDPHLYPGIENQIAEALETGGYVEKTIVQSFAPESLETLQGVNSRIRVCPLYGLWNLDLSDPRPENAGILCPMAEMVILNPWMIREAHLAGREVYVWFGISEHPVVMRILLAMGADGLMVDDPKALADILEK